MHWWDSGWHMGWMGLWWVIGLGLLVLLVVVAARGVRQPWTGLGSGEPPPETPEETLRKRYARGEIDEDTFRRMRDELRH